jgi:hypothetical protein
MAAAEHGKAMNLLMESKKYSDLTLLCGGREFAVHRAIVCPRSPFFDAACGGCFEECAMQLRPLFPSEC